MEAAVGPERVDRRGAARFADEARHGVQSTRVRPGHGAVLINVSASGALIETGHRLLPGSRVELLLERRKYRAAVRGRVVRCSVVGVSAAAIRYRGAIGFDQHLPWFVEPARPDATPQVV